MYVQHEHQPWEGSRKYVHCGSPPLRRDAWDPGKKQRCTSPTASGARRWSEGAVLEVELEAKSL